MAGKYDVDVSKIVYNKEFANEKYKDKCKNVSVGIRVNPECSTQKDHEIYDPCAKGSRLGVTLDNFREDLLPYIEGLHFHTLCEQNSDDLEITLDAVEEKFGKYLYQMYLYILVHCHLMNDQKKQQFFHLQ